jgi:hypothetical protein
MIKLATVALFAAFLAGCSITGEWKYQEFKPEVARQEFNFLGTGNLVKDFTGADITLRKDKTYTARVYYGDEAVITHGTWEKTDDKITFVDTGGHAYSYRYDREGNDLSLSEMVQGTEVTLTLER